MSYSFFRSITIDHGQCGSTDSTDFPLLFAGTFTWLKSVGNGGKLQSSSGFDMIFALDNAGATPIPYERVIHDVTTGVVEFWVKIPTLDHSSDTVIYVLYGDATVTTDQSNTTGTWASAYKGVWHLPDGTTLTANDSTSNANNGSLFNTPTATTGKIDGAANFTHASTQHIDVGTNASLDITGALTVELWGDYTDAAAHDWRAISHLSGGTPFKGWEVLFQSGPTSYQLQIGNGTGSGGNQGSGLSIIGSNALSLSTVYHIVVTFDGTNIGKIYVNGALDNSLTNLSTLGSNSGGHTYIGQWAGGGKTWQGWLDEIRVSNVVRNADYVTASYNNQNSPSGFVTVGAENGSTSNVTESVSDAIALSDAAAFRFGLQISVSDTITLSDAVALSVPIAFSFSDSLIFSDGAPTYITYDPSIAAQPGVTQDVIEVAEYKNQTHNPNHLLATQDVIEYGKLINPTLFVTQDVIEYGKSLTPHLIVTQTIIEVAYKGIHPKSHARYRWIRTAA